MLPTDTTLRVSNAHLVQAHALDLHAAFVQRLFCCLLFLLGHLLLPEAMVDRWIGDLLDWTGSQDEFVACIAFCRDRASASNWCK